MHIRRGLLFGGLFFITVGGIELLVRAGTIDANRLDEAWKLWPLILVGIGIAILLGRSRVAVVGTIIAAITVGAIVGGAIASGGGWIATITDCGGTQPTDQTTSEAGGFSGAVDHRPVDPLRHADLRHRLRCGLDLRRRLSRA